MTSGDVGAAGLCSGIIGAFFLAESFILKNRRQIARESADYFDGNPFLLRSACYQAIEARVGFVFLALGFVGQLLSQTSSAASAPVRSLPLIGVSASALLVVVFITVHFGARAFSRRMVATDWASSILHQLQKPERSQQDRFDIAYFYGPSLDLKPRNGETNEEFVCRLVSSVREWSACVQEDGPQTPSG